MVDVHCDGHLVLRRPEDIRNQPSATYYVYRQLEGTAWFEQRGRQLVAHAGDIVIADPNVAFSTGAEGTFDFRLWRLQRSRIEPMLALRSGELPMIKLERRSAEGALINSWLDGLLRSYGGMQTRSLDLAVGTLCALVADAAGLAPEMRDRGRDSRRAAQLQRVLRLLELRCADPDLNVEKVAGEFAMSVRALHQLFEPSGKHVPRAVDRSATAQSARPAERLGQCAAQHSRDRICCRLPRNVDLLPAVQAALRRDTRRDARARLGAIENRHRLAPAPIAVRYDPTPEPCGRRVQGFGCGSHRCAI